MLTAGVEATSTAKSELPYGSEYFRHTIGGRKEGLAAYSRVSDEVTALVEQGTSVQPQPLQKDVSHQVTPTAPASHSAASECNKPPVKV